MRPENETCIRNVHVIFPIRRDKKIQMNERSERVSIALDCLTKGCTDWQVTINRKNVAAISTTIDPKIVSNLLHEAGFKATEYYVEVEFIRKWGIL